jgi:endonuclease/exonuclease/phosphatase family metal-dependent hydrolase
MRVLTFDIHSGVGSDGELDIGRTARVVADADPDAACLQEVEVNTAPRQARSWSHTHADNQADVIARAAGLDNVHFLPTIEASFAPDLSASSEVGPRRTRVRARARETLTGLPWVQVLRSDGEAAYRIAIATRFEVLERRELRFRRDFSSFRQVERLRPCVCLLAGDC